MSAPGTLPSRQNSLRRAGTGSDVTAFEVGGQPAIDRHYLVSRVFTPSSAVRHFRRLDYCDV
jgi:hypothetical protein